MTVRHIRLVLLLVTVCLVAACGSQARRPGLMPFSQQVLDAATRVKERSGIDGDTIPLDSKDPIYSDYLERVRQKIKEKWGYPCVKDVASGRCDYKSPVRLVIVFGLLKDGRVPTLEVAHRAPYAIYDDYAANAIRLSQPFSPMPDAMARDHMGIVLVADFYYTLR